MSLLNSSSMYFNDRINYYVQIKDGVGIFFLSWAQGILSNVLGINNIYISLQNNFNTMNRTGVAYDTGRLMNLLLIFNPIELIDDTIPPVNPDIVSTTSRLDRQIE